VIGVDTSIVIAIIKDEPEAATFVDILDDSQMTIMSVVSYVEAHMVTNNRRLRTEATDVDNILAAAGIEIVDVTRDQAGLAVSAFLAYGKGRNRARLNLADCFSYALAKSRGAPLLFKGDDFSRTDIVPAWRP
jgi:ribonuclease VapC